MNKNAIRLIEPTQELCEAFGDFTQEFHAAGEKELLPGSGWKNEDNFATFMGRVHDFAQGRNLPGRWVPDSEYWLVCDERIIGVCGIRHRLNDSLRQFGGHLCYSIRPSERNKGYGTKMLKLTLEKVRQLGIHRVLITCPKDNLPAVRVIQKNGGVLDSEGVDPHDGTLSQRYWIELDAE